MVINFKNIVLKMEGLSRTEVRQQLRLRGVTVAAWAEANGFPVQSVYAVLNGRSSGLWGLSQQIAAALKLIPQADRSEKFNHLDVPNHSVEAGEIKR